MTMKLNFHTTCHSERAKHHRDMYVAHIKHSLTNEHEPDLVLCLVVRRGIHRDTTVRELEEVARLDGALVEPYLREIAREHGWLE